MTKSAILTWVAGGVILLDQFTKWSIDRWMRLHESVVVIEDFFSLTYIRNPGAAFGLFSQIGALRTPIFLAISLAALVVLTLFFFQTPRGETATLIALSLLFGGAIGNLVDRLRFGEVIDFLDFYVGQYHWPAFNVADSAITIGISLILATALPFRRHPSGALLRS